MQSLNEALYPGLKSLPDSERAGALNKARETPFDVIELVGIAIGLILVTAITRYQSGNWSGLEQISVALANFAIAVPLLAALVGPFLVRRVRRGLDQEIERRTAR